MNIKEQIFNDYWNQWGRLYIKERDYQQNTKSFPKKYKGVTVGVGFYYDTDNQCHDIKMHENVRICPFTPPVNIDYFKDNKLIKVEYVNDKADEAYVTIPVHKLWCSMSFKKKEDGEYHNTGWAIGDYYVARQLTTDEVDIINDENFNIGLNKFFNEKYQERLLQREQEKIEYEKQLSLKNALYNKLSNNIITKEEAKELLSMIAGETILKLVDVIYA